MKAIICGGRDYNEMIRLCHILDTAREWWNFSLIITGGARGADRLADMWARDRKIPTKVIPADWDTHRRSAGPIRNQLILDQGPDIVIAFKGGTGTEHMITIARKAGVPVFIV